MLTTENLSFEYPGSRRIFRFPDLMCSVDKPLLITGQSGCGKTTLLHLLAGILKPVNGSVRINQVELSGLSPAQADAFRGSHIGLIYQRPHFLAALNVLDNLQLAPYFGHKKVEKGRIETLTDRLGIGHTLKQRPARLSVGEQQRVSIARALVNRPALILADEPTSALDDHNCETVLHLLREHAQEQGAALLIVTHDGRLKTEFSNVITLESSNLKP